MRGLNQAVTRVRPPRAHLSSLCPRPISTIHCTHRPPQLLQIQSFLPFQFQSNQTSSISSSSSSNTMTTATEPSLPTDSPKSTTEQSEIQQILTLWFSDLPPTPATRWFMPNPDLDAQIKSNFKPLVVAARETNTLDTWTDTAQGTLALLLLLDQFSRNIYRHSASSSDAHLAYASDHKAQRVATEMIARGTDREVSFYGQAFVYTVFMHAEDLLAQVLGVSLQEGLVARAEAAAHDSQLDGEDIESLDQKWDGHDKDLVIKNLRASLSFSKRHLEAVRRFGRFCARNEALGRESTREEKEYLVENPSGF